MGLDDQLKLVQFHMLNAYLLYLAIRRKLIDNLAHISCYRYFKSDNGRFDLDLQAKVKFDIAIRFLI